MTVAASRTFQDGPDFICIGAQKAGTGWLYEQLRNHPDFWMPPMKELHYFDRIAGNSPAERSLPLARKEQDRLRIARERADDQRDEEFLKQFERLSGNLSLDVEGYAALFDPKRDLISGDITPGYSTVTDSWIEKITARFPGAKVIFIARDPVERAWSQLSMYVRRSLIEPFDPDDLEQLSRHLTRPEVRMRSYPSEIVSRWRRHVGAERFRTYFFDDLKSDPAGMRAAIIGFLGGDPMKASRTLAPDFNAKATKQKLSLTPAARSHLAQFFAGELRACATVLGGAAAEWPGRYRV